MSLRRRPDKVSPGVVPLVPRWLVPVFVLVSMLAAATTLVLATFDFSEQVHAPGLIVPRGGLVRIVAGEGGRVDRRLVHEGQSVSAETPLVALRRQDRHAPEEDAASDALLQQRIDAQEGEFRARIGALAARRGQLQEELSSLVADRDATSEQLALLRQRLALSERSLEQVQTLAASGYAAQTMVLNRQAEVLNERYGLSAAQGALVRVEAEIGSKRLALTALEAEVRQARAAFDGAAAALEQERIALEERTERTYRAGVDGIVVSLPQPEAQTVMPGAILAVIAPTEGRLEVELFVPSSAAARIQEGQRVKLRVEALPHERYGTASGTVAYVSPSTLNAADLNLHGSAVTGPIVKVRVELQQLELSGNGEVQPFRAGMLVRGSIEVANRSLLDILFGQVSPQRRGR